MMGKAKFEHVTCTSMHLEYKETFEENASKFLENSLLVVSKTSTKTSTKAQPF